MVRTLTKGSDGEYVFSWCPRVTNTDQKNLTTNTYLRAVSRGLMRGLYIWSRVISCLPGLRGTVRYKTDPALAFLCFPAARRSGDDGRRSKALP